jgi:glycosyltransferase involved in cell wall biosynthesis
VAATVGSEVRGGTLYGRTVTGGTARVAPILARDMLEPSPDTPAAGEAAVSVIVTTRNSARTLEPCLQSIRRQTHPKVEIIVADNDSSDDTIEIARRYANRVIGGGPERSAQRNRGVGEARGEYVLILDADMVLDSGVVASCVAAAREAEAAAVVVPEISFGEGFWAACRALERRCYLGDETIEAARFFRRSVFVRYGGYDEDLTGPEDWDLPARMRETETFARATSIIFHDEGRLRLRDHLRKKYYYGKSFGEYVRRHRELAARQLVILRPAFWRNRRQLARAPALAAGIVALKAAEFAAGALGVAVARFSSEPDG